MPGTGNGIHPDDGVSEVIGAVLLISIVVLAVAIIGVVLTSQPPPQEVPVVSAVISVHDATVRVYHDGGDTLRHSEVVILVDGLPVAVVKADDPGNPDWVSWSTGETLRYNAPSGTPGFVQVVYRSGSGASVVLASADFRT